MSLLIDACENGDVDQVLSLIDEGYGVNDPDAEGFTPLIYAAFSSQVQVCDVLIQNQADINAQANDGYGSKFSYTFQYIIALYSIILCESSLFPYIFLIILALIPLFKYP